MPLSGLVNELPARVMKADRLQEVDPAIGAHFVGAMANAREERARLDPRLADPIEIDTRDGTRLVLGNRSIVHFRQSGNAPELRCYVETDSAADTEALLGTMMDRLRAHM